MSLPPVSEFIAGALRKGINNSDKNPIPSCNDVYMNDSNSEESNKKPTSSSNSTIGISNGSKVGLEHISQSYQPQIGFVNPSNILLEYQLQNAPLQQHFQSQYPLQSVPNQSVPNQSVPTQSVSIQSVSTQSVSTQSVSTQSVSTQSSPNIMQGQRILEFSPYQGRVGQVYNLQASVEGLYRNQIGLCQNVLYVEAGPSMPAQFIQPRSTMLDIYRNQLPPVMLENPCVLSGSSSVDSILSPQVDTILDLQKKNRRIRRKHIFYRRSRSGCFTCKKRKVKCDEGKPGCRNCWKSNRICEGYPEKYTEDKSKSIPQINYMKDHNEHGNSPKV
ncbi:hypothetical protein CLIB1423_10S00100 [[Candida] railenensis]|uniref:Zn(2)-C6 fungal-type domain-containing protein n=1 Tax=[Candida] railenensis TaxID=45579 RepID=A0A9P0QQU6_9ASCO|nr:hypothetical protein CLIB1423_10S00100 [[Candida] railenensis]